MKQILISIIPYVALPFCLLLPAGLTGFGIVVALDVWGDFYFVDGLPMAATFLTAVSIVGLVLLTPAGDPFTFKRFQAALSSPIAQLKHRLPKRAAGRQSNQPDPQVATDSENFNTFGAGPTLRHDGSSLVHSIVVTGKPPDGSYNLNCSIKSEANQKL